MKKLIIAAFAVAFSITASAATYNWSALNDWFSPDGSDDLAGTIYLFDGSQYTISAITDNLTGSLANALGSQALSYGAFYLEGSGLTDDGATTPFAHMFAVVVNDAGDAYWASTMQDLEVTDAIKGGFPASFNFGDVENIAFTPMAAPEPTSGLLLLLGFAGLALRRRRA